MKQKLFLLLVIFLLTGITSSAFQVKQDYKVLFEKAKYTMETKADLKEAISLFESIIKIYPNEKEYVAKALLYQGMCFEKLGNQEAIKKYQRLVNNYPDQKGEVAIARERLSRLIQIAEEVLNAPFVLTNKKIWEIDNDDWGNISPFGKYISYTDWDYGNLIIREIATGNKRILTKEGSWEKNQYTENSTWSPDGKQIVYNWWNGNDFFELRIIDLGDSKPRILYKNEEVIFAQTFDWSGDGKQILACLQKKDHTRQIVLVSAENGSVRVLKTLVGKIWPNMNFSPDGRYIVYSLPYQESDIYLMSTDGSHEISLIKHPSNNYVLGWAPDGKNILFASDRTGTNDAFVIQVADGKPQGVPKLIKSDIGNLTPWGFTQKGSFYYSTSKGGDNVYTVDLDPGIGKILTPSKKAIKRFEGSNSYPYYSPNGKFLAYSSVRNDQGIICIRNLETGEDREFSLRQYNITLGRGLGWSPDCNSIVAMGKDNKRYGIFRMNVKTGIVTLIKPWENLKSTYYPHSCEWTSDGKTVFYVGFNAANGWSYNNLSQILVRNLETGIEKELYRFDNYINISLSPDEKWLVSIDGESLKVMPVNGGVPKELYEFKEGHGKQRPVSWSADGKYILFSKQEAEQDGWELCRIPAEGGELQKLGLEMEKEFNNLSAHPNGRNIAFSSSTQANAEFWVLENFLPLDNLSQKEEKERVIRLEKYAADINKKAEQHLKNGKKLLKLWEYEEAIKEYKNSIKLNPESRIAQDAKYWIGQAYYKDGRYDEALSTFEKLIKEYPESNIAPVTEFMIEQVQHTLENNKPSLMPEINADGNTIVEPETGITYTKIKTFTGKNDVISYTTGGFNMSPDNRFMVFENKVVPTDSRDPFKLVDMKAGRAVYSPDMKKAAFYADSAIWTVPVSPISGRSTGKPEKLLSGNYIFQNIVSWSPDGKRIAFSRRDDTIIDKIWTISVSNGKLMPVTNSSQIEFGPVWANDGKTIAYITYSSEYEIWLASANDNESKMIIKNGLYPRWSPDDKWLFYSDRENRSLFSLDRNKDYKFTIPKQVGNFASFSPDGKKMLFYRPSYDYIWRFKAVSTSGGPVYSPVTNGTVYNAEWSIDSKQILAMSENEKGESIYKIIPLLGGDPIEVKIKAKVNGKLTPWVFSHDLTMLTFSATREDGKKDVYITPFSMKEARTTGPARLVFENWSGAAHGSAFSWSPDGTRLALIHKENIWVVSIAGTDPLQITDTPNKVLATDWSPDGEMIGFLVQAKETRIAYVVPATGGTSKVVHNNCITLNWGPDSKSLALLANSELLIVSPSGEKLKHIINLNDLGINDTSSPKYSPDGKHIAFIGNYGSKSIIFMYSVENEKFTRLADENPDEYMYSLRWSPDGKWLSYLTVEYVKVRSGGSLWEADFEEVKGKLPAKN